ncbi:14016_t:CDS:2 [Acaulospora colombiana]|uniref:14016_t:CDS:1 n=1 Tax=Acaulospora colombiana TaxID=27376 RepID=A0ACA9LRP8_9GLOM|nr:14016_t:CDS:2 [Acaulospora colombiana]
MRFFTTLAFIAAVAFVALGVEAQSSTPTSSAALPSFTYNLVNEPLGDRQNLCNQNIAYCQNNCGGINEAPKNFCNVTTMGWGCCGTPKQPPAYYEVDDASTTPTYGPASNSSSSTSTVGSTSSSSTSSPNNNSTTTQSSANALSYSMIYLLIVVAAGMMTL